MTNNINPIRLGITGNQYYKKEEKEDLAKDSRKQAQAAPEERKTLETDAVLSYLATKNADILPSKGKKTVDVSKYVNAEQAARIEEFMKAFEEYDLLLAPTTTTAAYKLGKGLSDPLKSFMDDVLVIPANMAGLPALNLPAGFNDKHIPIGVQIIGAPFDEARIYQLASFLEEKLNLDLRGGHHEWL